MGNFLETVDLEKTLGTIGDILGQSGYGNVGDVVSGLGDLAGQFGLTGATPAGVGSAGGLQQDVLQRVDTTTSPNGTGTQRRQGDFVPDADMEEALEKKKKRRRRNPMNARANRNAMNRLKGAHRFATQLLCDLDSFAAPKPRRRRTAARKCCTK